MQQMDGTALSSVRARGVVAAAGLVYLLGLGILLIAPLRVVRYHTLFWQFTGRVRPCASVSKCGQG